MLKVEDFAPMGDDFTSDDGKIYGKKFLVLGCMVIAFSSNTDFPGKWLVVTPTEDHKHMNIIDMLTATSVDDAMAQYVGEINEGEKDSGVGPVFDMIRDIMSAE